MSLLDIYCILVVTTFVTDISNVIKIKFRSVLNKEHYSLGKILRIYFNNMNSDIIFNIIPLVNVKKARDRRKKYYENIKTFNETLGNIINASDSIHINSEESEVDNVAISLNDTYKNGSVLLACNSKSKDAIKLYPIKFYNEYPYLDKDIYSLNIDLIDLNKIYNDSIDIVKFRNKIYKCFLSIKEEFKFSKEVNNYLDKYYSKAIKTIIYFIYSKELEKLVGKNSVVII